MGFLSENKLKMVLFENYCPKCKNEAVDENDEPCEACISEFANLVSHKPIKFEEKE